MNDQSLLTKVWHRISTFAAYLLAFLAAPVYPQRVSGRRLHLRISLASLVLLTSLFTGAFAQTSQVNLSLTKSINNASPILGEVVTYTVAVTNTGSATATSVVVSDSMALGYSTVQSTSVSVGTYSTTAATGISTWTIGSIAPGQTVTLLVKARVDAEGVAFNAAEVQSMDGTDANSIPGNGNLLEDDYDNACFSVPITWYAGDEYTVDKPTGFTSFTWLSGGNPISASTTEASVDVNGNLVIKGPGIFSFAALRNSCPVSNCCNIIVQPGKTAGLGNYVFEDKNADGIQNAGDVAIPGVVVTLYQNGSAIATTTTDASGLYSFTGLTPGSSNSYAVGFATPTGFTTTAPLVGGNGAFDSDVNPLTGKTASVTLAPGEVNPDVDAGYFKPASIGDYVFNDANKDGVQNAGDSPIPGVVVTLYLNGSAVATTTSNGSGLYSFTGLTPGTSNSYAVGFGTPSNFTATSPLSGTDTALDSNVNPATGLTASLTLSSGESNTTIDAGFYLLTAGLGDYVFEDKNANGIQDAGDTGIPGVLVTLYSSGSALATTTTNPTGFYSFTGLTPGMSYTVGFGTPAGFLPTLANIGNDGLDSDAGVGGLTGPYSLSANEFNSTVDAGFYKPGSIGDYVFNDANHNGVQDAGDSPIPGVVVTLYLNGSAVATTTTNGSGLYSFTGLTPGTGNVYQVGFGTPSNFTATSPLSGTDTALDSNVNPATGLTASLTLSSGESNTTIDAGFYLLTAGLGDYVFEDKNANGIQDAGDTGIPGVLVTLYSSGSALATTTTNPTGFYSFTGLTPGMSYTVGFGTPAGFLPTLANIGNDGLDSDAGVGGLTGPYSLSANEFNSTVDAGFYKPGSIGDYVFNDANHNGVQDAGDSPIPGVVVTLYLNGSAVATTTSNGSGLYSFTGLTPGTSNSYAVGFGTPSNFTATSPLSGTDTALDSNVNPATGLTASLTLSSGESNTTIDAGFYLLTAGLGDYVFEDKNANGIQDAGDTGIPGVLVTLYSSGSALATTTTNPTGFYSFTGLTPGVSYTVGFGTPAGFLPTLANIGNDGLDSDAGVGGLTGPYSLSANEFNSTVDAGFYKPASIGDYVFNDTNRDGIQNAGDSPIPGVIVTLYLNGSAVATTTTNGTGLYSFTGLTPGVSNSYVVGFATPATFTVTSPLSGTNKALDSDANPITGLTASLTLSSGESNTTIDAGFYQPSAGLGDYVFYDTDKDGLQTIDDFPLEDILVTLFQNGSAVATTLTNPDGFYSFTGLTPGGNNNYSVGFTTPVGLTATTSHVGVDTTIDSDLDPVTGRTQSVTLGANEFNVTLDAGFIPSDEPLHDSPVMASLGDYVFNDANKDGIQNAGDTPIPGVVVTLYLNGSAVATTTTGATGLYSFTGLYPGNNRNYVVGFMPPANFTATLTNVGSDTADSDADPITGKTQSVTLVPNENNPTLDAGFYLLTAGLGDYVFEDKNANGVQDVGDLGIPGVLVTLYSSGSALATTTTNPTGFYSFTGLTPGMSYTVGFGTPAGFLPTLANIGNDGLDSDAGVGGLTGPYSLSANEFNSTVDAGFYKPGSIGDYVFNDANHNGVQDAGDSPIPGVVVTLYLNGSAVATTTTNGSGLYSFTGLTPGTGNVYQVGFGTPSNFTATSPLSGTDTALDSNVNPATGLTASLTLSSGESNTTIDAGFYLLTAGLGDYVFEDKNANGIQDAGDTGIPGVLVTLYSSGSALATTTTNPTGFYSFTGLTPGMSYTVGFGTPAGFLPTLANIGNDGLDSDAGVGGLTGPYSLSANEFNSTVDAGFYKPGSIGDYVFNDANHNGVQDAGDSPIPGVVVTLYLNGSAVATTTTNGSGLYSFTGLTPGGSNSYAVGFTAPAGYSATTPLSGTDKTLDSDLNPLTGRSVSVTLSSGQSNSTVDAGFFLIPAGLGDYVFEDKNLDGIQNGGDVAIPGVLVTLYQNGSAVATTLTNGTGFYSFTGLTPGSANSYVVGFTKPTGFGATAPLSGTDTTKDSNADIVTGKTASVTLAPGEFNDTIDAGFFRTGSIGDYVFIDTDHSGTQTPGDKPLQGVIITLYQNGSVIATTVSDVNGAYSFTGLTPGASNSYTVGFTKPSGFNSTSANVGSNGTIDSDPDPVTGLTKSFTLSNGESNTNVDAGYVPQSAGLGDYVFDDKNANGIQDVGDLGIPGVLVTLYSSGSAIATTTTNPTGFYSFTGLTPNTPYYVGFGKPTGYTPTLAHVGSNSALDSDASVTTGLSQTVTLTDMEFNATIDAGFFRPASLGDYVFVDKNRDGIQNAGDTPLSGVVVTLYLNGSAVATTTTNGSGAYSFTGLAPGTTNVYQVGFAKPAGFDATSALVGGDRTIDSDADPITGRSPSLTLSSGESNTSVDAGYLPQLGAIGDFVWYDYNSDGQQAPVGEPGVPGLVVTLYQSGSAIRTTLTDSNGKYLFDGLASGQYTVGFVAPAGSVLTTPFSGTDHTLDSDANQITGITDLITIDVTQPLSSTARVNLTIDAGIVPYGSIGNYVWRDTNNDGIQNDGPTGIPNIKVQLFAATDLTNPLDETVTDGNGYYLFTQLITGNYNVKFTLPSGEIFTSQGAGLDRGLDSNPDATGFSGIVSINTSLPLGSQDRDNLTIDAGVKAKCSTPIILTASVAGPICVGDVASVSATAPGAVVIRWYLAAIGNTVAFTSANGQTVPVDVSMSTTYYVEAETADGCKSERKPVTIIVNARPNTPSIVKEVTICQDAVFDLTKVILNNVPLPGSTLEWHTGNSPTSPLVASLTAVTAGEYYLFEKSKFGCYSYPTVLTVSQIDCRCQNLAVVSTTLTSGSVCEGGPIKLIASIGGSATSVTWMTSTSTSTGILTMANSLTAYYMPSAADIAAGIVQFTVTTNDPDGSGYCVPAKSSVIVTISPRPDAPLGAACEDEILCKGGSTKLFGFTASNGKINWYNKATGLLVGTSMNGKPLTVTPMASTTYLAEAVSVAGCTSRSLVEVVVTVKATCLADLAVAKTVLTAGPYKLNDVVSYGIMAKNNGPVTATSVTVSDLLPATLEYVSATPAADYNAATGVWTVGTLTSGSDRNLIIQARVKGTGTLTNTAIINSPDNDPTKPENNTSTATITVDQCAVNPPTIACAVTALCGQDESTVLTARDCDGTIKWSNGMTGSRITVTPGITTAYSASCMVGVCTSGSSNTITVSVTNAPTPTILASAEQVCIGGVVSLTAVGCENGTVYWSDGMIGNVVSLTLTGETLITAQCRVNNCYSKAATTSIKVGNDLPKPTVVCSTTEVCPGETVTLTAQNCMGTPHWSTGETTASITVTPTAGNNSYSVYCTNGGNCTSPRSNDYTIRIIPAAIPTVTASTTSICVGGVVSLTASGCEGKVMWSNNMTGNVISVTLNASESFYATCKVRDCVSDPSKSVAITVGKPQAPTIRAIPNTAICAGESVTLTVAEGCANGTVKWTNTDLTGRTIVVMPGVNTDYTATCVADGNCTSSASNVVKVIVKTAGTAPTIMASSTAVCTGASVTLTASGCANGEVMWSNNTTGASIVVTPTAAMHSFYAICKQADLCGSPQSRTIDINLTTPPAPTVVCSTSVICPGESLDLTVQNCAGSPVWSTGAADNGKTTITVHPTVMTSYSVICKDANGCTSAPSQLYTITVVPVNPLVLTASKTEITPGESVTLTATGCPMGGVVTWSNNQTGSMIVIAPTAAVSYYTATCRYRSCTSDPSLTITIKQKGPDNCTAKAGTLVTSTTAVCASSLTVVTLSATDNGGRVVPSGYSVIYVLTKGAGLVIQQTSNTSSFTVPATAADIYTIHTLVYDPKTLDLSVVKPGVTTGMDVLNLIQTNKLCADLDMAGAHTKVKYVPAPIVLGPNRDVQCYGAVVSFTATGCENGSIAWSNGAIGSVVSLTVLTEHWFFATCTQDGCTSDKSYMVDVYLGQPTVPTVACNKPSVCAGDAATLTAIGCEGGTYIWSTGAVGSSITVTPQTSTTYAVKCVIGKCESAWSPVCSLTVGAPPTPTVTVNDASGTISTCYGAPVTLTAKGCPAGSYVVWSNNMVGSSITVTPAASATYSAQCCTSTNCKSQRSNVITLTVQPKVPQPATTDLTNACPFKSVNLANGVGAIATAGGTFEYYTTSTLEPASKLANTNVTVSGTYYVVEKTTTGCYSLPSTIQVNITTCGEQLPCGDNPVTANAGKDDQICAAKSYKLAGVISGTNVTAQWKTSGTGTFDNAFSPTALYVPSLTDVQAGQVTLTLSVQASNTACPAQSDQMVLAINGPKIQPAIKIVGALQLCAGENVTLEAPAGYTYLWSNKATTQSIVVDKSGNYSVQVFDQGLCSSVPSEAVSVTVAAPIPAPLVVNLRNICPATTVDLSAALAGVTPKPGSTYEYHIGIDPTGGSPMNSSVGECTFYVFERTANQCLSLPAKVTVKITDCTNNTQTADVRITKTVSNTAAHTGDLLSYTLTVTNFGPNTATNVDIRDILPAGLNLVPGAAPLAYTVTSGAVLKRFESLSVNQSASIVVNARLTAKGNVTNMAQITYSDVNDPLANNNKSSVTVSDNTPNRAGAIGLAKGIVGTPVMIDAHTFAATYQFTVTNYGDEAITNVGITDNLDAAFGTHDVSGTPTSNVVASQITTDVANDLDLNPGYSGSGANTQLLASTSKLAAGETATVMLSLTVLKQTDAVTTYSNTAMATATNATTQVSDQSMSGLNADPDGDLDPTNNTGATIFQIDGNVPAPEARQLGVALNVASTDLQPDGSHNITYQVFVKNFGTTLLTNVSLLDTLSNAFRAPVSFSLVGKPTLSAGSNLVLSNDYNGTTAPYFLVGSISSLAAGQQDVITFTVNVQHGANNGPFYSSVTGTARPESSTVTVRDWSNAGSTIFPAIDQPTAVRFDLPAGLIGLAKEVGTPVLVNQANQVYDIPYLIKLCNLGTADLKRVQLVDDLSKTFGSGASVQSVTITADEGLKVNTGYTGLGLLTSMLDTTASSLPVKAIKYVRLVVRVNLSAATSLTFTNTAVGSGMSGTTTVSDDSNAGSNVDPDNDLDPRNNNDGTLVKVSSLPGLSYIGVALSVRDTARQANGSYNVTYRVVVKNYGNVALTNVLVTDSLSRVFNGQVGADFSILGTPIASTGSKLKLNPGFNGGSNPVLVLGDSTSKLGVGATDTLLVRINVTTTGQTGLFFNTVYAIAKAGLETLRDVSTNGLNPDLNGNNNPTDPNESEATPLTLLLSDQILFIPQGFSPNGDGINDLFVIQGAQTQTVNLQVFNRWGHRVYVSEDYKNDWDGKANTGVQVGKTSTDGLPDGTYYYVVKLSDGREFVRFMTINR